MQKLIDCAAATGAQFEIYSCSSEKKTVSIENSELKEAECSLASGVSLRLVKDGLYGFAYTKNLGDPAGLVNNALASLKAGVEAKFTFPKTGGMKQLRTYSENAEAITSTDLLQEASRMRDILAKRAKGQINTGMAAATGAFRIFNSSGTDLAWKESQVTAFGSVISAGGDNYTEADCGLDRASIPEERLEAAAELFEVGRREVRPKAGKHKVLFMPEALYTLLWRVQSGANGQNLYQKTTPLAGKEGQKLFSEILTVRNNPLNDAVPGARAVDDEGTPCADFPVIEKGVFRGFYYDLNYAAKTGARPTGHGFRRAMWGGDTVVMRPLPYLGHLYFDKGEKTFAELLREMGTGLVVFGALGAHSGNIPNGDFSIGLAPGLYVENGAVVGKAKDTMVSGNIYDMMNRAIAAGCEAAPIYANNPPLLFDGLDVAC
ncbi:MAG: metallopeptidase TldD-related protein [Elusimicrobiales bacterium]|nr:metallopeptidase TldD-related protein [Elusimicrobiales bacterium]